MTRFLALLAVCVLPVLLLACSGEEAQNAAVPEQQKPYLAIQEIDAGDGLAVWFVRDTGLPLVALKFSLDNGTADEPDGKEGVTRLLASMLDEGAGTRDAGAFHDALDRHGIRIGFSASLDYFSGSLKTTTAHYALALELFDDALNRPHLDKDALQRMREALRSNLRFNQMNPQWLAGRLLMETVFAGQDYARPVEGTLASLAALTRADVVQRKEQVFCRNGLKIAVVGDLDETAVRDMVRRLFGAWPLCAGHTTRPAQKMLQQGETATQIRDGAQHSVVLVQEGIARRHKDWWAARILDFALGSGQFSSRLMDKVRVQHGLTYGVSSALVAYPRGPVWLVQSSVAPDKTPQAIAMIKAIWREVAQNGLTDAEIAAAKSYLTGVLPLSLTSTDRIAAILLQLQQDGLPVDTLDRRAQEIAAVTAQDVKRVAATLLQPDALTTVIVGPELLPETAAQ